MPSPSRRVCHVPPNKRVEMLRTCEVDLRREPSKTGKCDESPKKEPPHIEVPSIPSSPARCSPRKTHITNFMHQNDMSVKLLHATDTHSPEPQFKMKRSPCVRFDDLKLSPPKSPKPRRRLHSQSPRFLIEESDTESDQSAMPKSNGFHQRYKENQFQESMMKSPAMESPPQTVTRSVNSNIGKLDAHIFRAIEMSSSPDTTTGYCPQSEPLKRKIYSEKTLDRLQKSLEVDAGKSLFIELSQNLKSKFEIEI